jgi:hypothetical protein
LWQSAPFKFAPANSRAYFEELGWRAVELESVFTAATDSIGCRGGCAFWLGCPSRIRAILPNKTWSGVVRLRQA